MRQVTINLYKYNELQPKAISTARNGAFQKMFRSYQDTFITHDFNQKFVDAMNALGFEDVVITTKDFVDDTLTLKATYVGGGDIKSFLNVGLTGMRPSIVERFEKFLNDPLKAYDGGLETFKFELFNDPHFATHIYDWNGRYDVKRIWDLKLNDVMRMMSSIYRMMGVDLYGALVDDQKILDRYIKEYDFEYMADGTIFKDSYL